MTGRERSQVQASEMRFLQRLKGVTLFENCEVLRFKNLLTSSWYFSELKDFSLNGLAM